MGVGGRFVGGFCWLRRGVGRGMGGLGGVDGRGGLDLFGNRG